LGWQAVEFGFKKIKIEKNSNAQRRGGASAKARPEARNHDVVTAVGGRCTLRQHLKNKKQ
jgi:hypothetical protein